MDVVQTMLFHAIQDKTFSRQSTTFLNPHQNSASLDPSSFAMQTPLDDNAC